MIVDTSAIVAIAREENEQLALVAALSLADSVQISTGTWLELSLVLGGSRIPDVDGFLTGFVRQFAVQLVPFSEEHSAAAVVAWRRFGRGNHPARLNFGDCISYATAKLAGQPLLYVGNDFALTDIVSAL